MKFGKTENPIVGKTKAKRIVKHIKRSGYKKSRIKRCEERL